MLVPDNLSHLHVRMLGEIFDVKEKQRDLSGASKMLGCAYDLTLDSYVPHRVLQLSGKLREGDDSHFGFKVRK